MRFAGDDSHVRRLTKKEYASKKDGGLFTVKEKQQKKLSPSKEQYIVTKTYTDPFEGKTYYEGDVISNRQGRNVQIQEQGNYRSYSQYNNVWSPRAKASSQDVQNRNAWIRKASRSTGRTPNSIRTDPKFRQAWTEFHVINKDNRKDVSPTGPLAKILIAAGLRDPKATYKVGDTPKDDRRKRK